MKQLRPLVFKDEYYKTVEDKIQKFWNEVLFNKLISIIKSKVDSFLNARGSSLIDALLKGKVQFVDGKFYGNFNTSIGKELRGLGAKYNTFSKTWNISKDRLPVDIQSAIVQAIARFQGLNEALMRQLSNDDFSKQLDDLDFTSEYNNAVLQMNEDFIDAYKIVGVVPELSDDMVKVIAEEYNNNLKLYIKEWTDGQILKLRKVVEKNVFEGYRAESLIKGIQSQYEVSAHKARFLARQETSLLMSKFRETRYKDIGVTEYIWSTSNDQRVRDRHRKLHGKRISWDSPPVVDDKGNRKHAGEDFGCRCLAKPIITY